MGLPVTIGRVPGVYLSYPFCAQKCTYCNFASDVLPRALSHRYLDALRREIRAHAWEWTPETVFLGGGTPSMMETAELKSLLDAIPGQPWTEATLEAAPGNITLEMARAWAAAGINRVSLGVQSFVDREIRRTGRKHDAATVAREIEILREAGISNCNVDLIAGLSGQTEASWNESLDWIERLRPPHVSVYMLEVDEDSRLGKEMLLGGVRYGAGDTPDEDAVATMYETAVARLAAMGIARYEISNFARPGAESRHNLKYWRLEPYIGFGADAHSFQPLPGSPKREYGRGSVTASARRDASVTDASVTEPRPFRSGSLRWQNPKSVTEYLAGAEQTKDLSGDDERFFVGLRLMEGIRPTPAEWRRFDQPIKRFVAAGLLASADGILRLTSRGVMLSNEVFQEFLAA